jgi:hypothetical protein
MPSAARQDGWLLVGGPAPRRLPNLLLEPRVPEPASNLLGPDRDAAPWAPSGHLPVGTRCERCRVQTKTHVRPPPILRRFSSQLRQGRPPEPKVSGSNPLGRASLRLGAIVDPKVAAFGSGSSARSGALRPRILPGARAFGSAPSWIRRWLPSAAGLRRARARFDHESTRARELGRAQEPDVTRRASAIGSTRSGTMGRDAALRMDGRVCLQ